MRVNFQTILVMPRLVRGAPRLRADIVLAENAPGRQQQGKAWAGAFIGRDIVCHDEQALAAHEMVDVHGGRAFGSGFVDRPLERLLVQHLIAHACESRRQPRNLVHDLRRVRVSPVQVQGVGDKLDHFPVGITILRLHHLAHALDAALCIGESAVLFEEGGAGQEHVRIVRCLVEKEVLHHHAFHRRQAGRHMSRIRVRLEDILALNEDALERAVRSRIQHVGDAQARFGIQGDAPVPREQRSRGLVRHVSIAGKLVRKTAHVARALNVVLPTQRIDAGALLPDIAGRHGQIGYGHNRGGALAVLSHSKAIVDRCIAAGGIEPGGGAQIGGGNASQILDRFG